MLARIETGELPLDATVAGQSLESAAFNLIHLARICNQQSTVWESNLAAVDVSSAVPSYDSFVVAGGMREAVYERVLTGDTYFTQFRGLHQIPEILGEEVNDRLEQAIRALRTAVCTRPRSSSDVSTRCLNQSSRRCPPSSTTWQRPIITTSARTSD